MRTNLPVEPTPEEQQKKKGTQVNNLYKYKMKIDSERQQTRERTMNEEQMMLDWPWIKLLPQPPSGKGATWPQYSQSPLPSGPNISLWGPLLVMTAKENVNSIQKGAPAEIKGFCTKFWENKSCLELGKMGEALFPNERQRVFLKNPCKKTGFWVPWSNLRFLH